MSAELEPGVARPLPPTSRRRSYRLVVVSDEDGAVQEIRLSHLAHAASYVVPMFLALVIGSFLYLFGAYTNAAQVSRVQAAKITHLAAKVEQGKKVVGVYHNSLSLSSAIGAETNALISAVKSAQGHLAKITGRQTPGSEGLSGLLGVLEKIQSLLPTTTHTGTAPRAP